MYISEGIQKVKLKPSTAKGKNHLTKDFALVLVTTFGKCGIPSAHHEWSFSSLILCITHHIIQEDQPQSISSNPNSDVPVVTTSSQQTVPMTNVQADKIVPNKSLLDWLRQQSDYTLEIPGFGTVSISPTFQSCACLLGSNFRL